MNRRVSFPTPTRSAICPIVFPSMRGATTVPLWRFSILGRPALKSCCFSTLQAGAKGFFRPADTLITRPRQGGRGQRDTDVNCLKPGKELTGWKIPPPAIGSRPRVLPRKRVADLLRRVSALCPPPPLKFAPFLPIHYAANTESADPARDR